MNNLIALQTHFLIRKKYNFCFYDLSVTNFTVEAIEIIIINITAKYFYHNLFQSIFFLKMSVVASLLQAQCPNRRIMGRHFHGFKYARSKGHLILFRFRINIFIIISKLLYPLTVTLFKNSVVTIGSSEVIITFTLPWLSPWKLQNCIT